MVQLNIFEILGIPLINFEVNHFLNCSANCFIMAGAIDGQVQYCNIDSPVSTFAIIDNAKPLQKLKSGFKR